MVRFNRPISCYYSSIPTLPDTMLIDAKTFVENPLYSSEKDLRTPYIKPPSSFSIEVKKSTHSLTNSVKQVRKLKKTLRYTFSSLQTTAKEILENKLKSNETCLLKKLENVENYRQIKSELKNYLYEINESIDEDLLTVKDTITSLIERYQDKKKKTMGKIVELTSRREILSLPSDFQEQIHCKSGAYSYTIVIKGIEDIFEKLEHYILYEEFKKRQDTPFVIDKIHDDSIDPLYLEFQSVIEKLHAINPFNRKADF